LLYPPSFSGTADFRRRFPWKIPRFLDFSETLVFCHSRHASDFSARLDRHYRRVLRQSAPKHRAIIVAPHDRTHFRGAATRIPRRETPSEARDKHERDERVPSPLPVLRSRPGRNSSVSPVCGIRKENLQVRFIKRNERFHRTSHMYRRSSFFSGFRDFFPDADYTPGEATRFSVVTLISLVCHNRASLFIPQTTLILHRSNRAPLCVHRLVTSLVAPLRLFTLALFSSRFHGRTSAREEYHWTFGNNKLD